MANLPQRPACQIALVKLPHRPVCQLKRVELPQRSACKVGRVKLAHKSHEGIYWKVISALLKGINQVFGLALILNSLFTKPFPRPFLSNKLFNIKRKFIVFYSFFNPITSLFILSLFFDDFWFDSNGIKLRIYYLLWNQNRTGKSRKVSVRKIPWKFSVLPWYPYK